MADTTPRASTRTPSGMRQLTNAVNQLSTRVEAFDAKLSRLDDLFLPRREATEIVSGLREDISESKQRLTALEEWRLAETRRAATEQTAVQTQIGATATATAHQRMEVDARTLNTLWGLLVGLVITIVGTALGYALWHLHP